MFKFAYFNEILPIRSRESSSMNTYESHPLNILKTQGKKKLIALIKEYILFYFLFYKIIYFINLRLIYFIFKTKLVECLYHLEFIRIV